MGIANAIMFAWKEKEMEPFVRETFGRTIHILKLEVKDVLCLQANPLEGAYDVVLHTEGKHDEVMGRVKVVEKARPMCHYEVASLARNSFRVVTVNMFNPHVKEEEVRAFLGRYMDNVSSARLLKDMLGFWNGRRRFQALLKEDPGGLGGYLHPPALFSLGADGGTLFYARQPPFCRRCMTYGHIFASCGGGSAGCVGQGRTRRKTVVSQRNATGVDQQHICGGTARLATSHMQRLQGGGEQVQERGMGEEMEREFQTRAKGQWEVRLQQRRRREKQREERRMGRGRKEKDRKERRERRR
ncbi:unnamed protein product [Coregonus sp. 'balchen']|nr:unnamed protein product [Coregonus sp. 'balchen']